MRIKKEDGNFPELYKLLIYSAFTNKLSYLGKMLGEEELNQ